MGCKSLKHSLCVLVHERFCESLRIMDIQLKVRIGVTLGQASIKSSFPGMFKASTSWPLCEYVFFFLATIYWKKVLHQPLHCEHAYLSLHIYPFVYYVLFILVNIMISPWLIKCCHYCMICLLSLIYWSGEF